MLSKKLGTGANFGYFHLYRYATCLERVICVLGVLFSVGAAVALLATILLYSEVSLMYINRTVRIGTTPTTYILPIFGGGRIITNATIEDNKEALLADAAAYGIGSVAVFILQFITASLSIHALNWSAGRQILRIRRLFLEQVLRQDISYFDTETNLNFTTSFTGDLEKLKEGIAEKVSMFAYLAGSIVICAIFALVYGWDLALSALAIVPLSIIANAVVSKLQVRYSNAETLAYSHAGRVVEEVLSGIRTVIAFGGEEKEIDRYKERLSPTEKCAKMRGVVTGIGIGVSWFLTYSLNAIIFMYGTRLIMRDAQLPIEQQKYNPGNMITILYCVYLVAQNIAMCNPHTEAFSGALGAARSLFAILDKKPQIDSMSEAGVKPDSLKGEIVLNNVYFNYPSRPDVKILRGLTLHIKAGETVALVGTSGCGKSTVLQLVQRLYDAASGTVMIDGERLQNINLQWFRSHIGVVGQEPVLFSGTIKENIALGKQEASLDEVIHSARAAHAHEFIKLLDQGYDTIIGERGAQLSGGQKQRIAIARSLIRDPKILLLDEATSALDVKSEKIVQTALDEARDGRTTLVVSHRLSTIYNASRIVYIHEGVVAEEGTHEELLAKQGLYWKLVHSDLDQRRSSSIDTVLEEDVVENVDENHPHDVTCKEQKFTQKLHRSHQTQQHKSSIKRRGSATPKDIRSCSISSIGSIGIPHMITTVPGIENCESSQFSDSNVEVLKIGWWSLLKLNGPEWPHMVIGSIASLFVGATLPVLCILFAEVMGMYTSTDTDSVIATADFYGAMFLVVSGVCGLGNFLQTYVFTVAGLKLTSRLRVNMFQKYMRQEIAWYDDQNNSVGALCARLNGDAAAVQGATGTKIGTLLQAAGTMLIGIVISMYFSWKMTMVSMVAIPIIIGAIYLEGIIMSKSQEQERKSMEKASKVATEAIMNVRTVQSMGIERDILARYNSAVEEASRLGGVTGRLRGSVYALGLGGHFLGDALAMYYGGVLMANGELEYKIAVMITGILIYGSWMMGQALSFAPNFSSAAASGARVVAALQRESMIVNPAGVKEDPTWRAKGEVHYRDVEFKYPTRSDMSVLRGLNLSVSAGSTIALVGHSGCGKSTTLQLLQRMYDADSGQVDLDSRNVTTDLTLSQLRSQLGIVQQEPVLFEKTITENIQYGDNSRNVPIEEVMKAAEAANIHNFITGLPQGYDTQLGSKGAQLSGGQKQRIAIARALVRNPRVLLLDEATSALDNESEKLVQSALDAASCGRTCIVIAHRLTTVRHADCICVIDQGKVIEKGSHDELVQKRGLYYDLYQMQGLGPVKTL